MDRLETIRRYLKFYFLTVILLGSSAGAQNSGIEVAKNRVKFVHLPNDVVVDLGSAATLRCAAVGEEGQRLPVTWLHNGTVIRKNEEAIYLRNLQWLDEGSYQCLVSVGEGSVLSLPGVVRIARHAQFTLHPQDTNARIGGSARFTCSAHAIPSVLLTWLHNHLPLEDIRKSRFRSFDSGILQITDVQSSDEGSYLCIASNSAGNVTSRPALLTATSDDVPQDAAKKGLKVISFTKNQSVVVGEDAFFECFFTSSSTPNVTWKRLSDGGINRDRMEIIGSNLRIKKVEQWDEGFYACSAKVSNENENAVTLKAYLRVLFKPEITEYPKIQNKRRGETGRFSCLSRGNPVPQIIWYKDGNRVRPHGRLKVFPAESEPVHMIGMPHGVKHYGRDLVVSSIQPEDVGIYQCFVKNSVGMVTAAAELNFIKVDSNISAEAPRNLRALVDNDRKQIRLQWDAPPRPPFNPEKLSVYIIHFYETNGPSRENTHAAGPDACDENGKCETSCCTSDELKDYKNYTFKVSGVFHDATFLPLSEPVLVKTWEGVAKGVAPLTVTGLPGGSVLLEWEIPDSELIPGHLEEFRIEYYRDGGTKDLKIIRVPFLIQERTINGLLPGGGGYYFRVIPKTGAGYPEMLSAARYPWTRYHIPPSEVVVFPAPQLEVKPVNSTAALVTWVPEGEAPPAFRIRYQLQSDAEVRAKDTIVGSEERSFVIGGLKASSLYEVSVACVNEEGEASLESSQMVRTLPQPLCTECPPPNGNTYSPPPPPLDVWCEMTDIGSLLVKWSPSMSSHEISRYRIRYTPVPKDPLEPLNASLLEYVEVSKQEVEVRYLMENRIYTFQVMAFDALNFTGPYSEKFSCRSPKLPGPPLNVRVEVLNSSSLVVEWDPPVRDREVNVVAYYVLVTGHPPNGQWKQSRVNGSERRAVVGGLEKGRQYYIKVKAESGGGEGKSSEAVVTVLKEIIVVKVSYKEGIIIGGCIALVCIIVCASILLCKARQESNVRGEECFLCWRCGREMNRNNPSRLKNGHLANGDLAHVSAPQETQELQTLLPAYEVNPDCDAKGGVNGTQPRCSRFLRHGAPQIPTVSEHDSSCSFTNGHIGFLDVTPLKKDDLMVAVAMGNGEACRDREGVVEISSDLSHSPAQTASSLHSWNQDHQQRRHTATSMPNLADSGIGFEENSMGMKGLCWCGAGRGTRNGLVSTFRSGTS